MAVKPFTDTYIRSLKPKAERYEISEPGGLRLRVSSSGKKSWVYVYRQNKRLRRLTIGRYPNISLSAARVEIAKARLTREKGIDPAIEAQLKTQKRLHAPTVEQLISLYIEQHAKLKKKTWKEDKRALSVELLPLYGMVKAADIRRSDIVYLLEKIAQRAPISANRALEIIRKMFNWAVEREIVEINPCWQVSRPSQENKRERALSESELKALWTILESARCKLAYTKNFIWPSKAIRLALQLSLVTAQRRSEIALATINEFDLTEKVWTIPKEHTKNGREHYVPLSTVSVRLIKELITLNKGSNFLLPSRQGNKPIKAGALTRAV
ncbi:integrase, phage related protein [marine gamma proteobacterium HTCC2143]|uniref:Integrase, phage related protein n=1 Tax=marine gamma proteobacterium HTCC2143 TaxID=247633 RepID=A0YFV5_9GAMM|nr:integrase, phage related protein [marine gamma proteobacterium HTCC2143]